MHKIARYLTFSSKILFCNFLSFSNKISYLFFVSAHNFEKQLNRLNLLTKVDPLIFDSTFQSFSDHKNALNEFRKIELVNYESFFGLTGILERFTQKLRDGLSVSKIKSEITSFPSGGEHAYFHIFYRFALPVKNAINVVLVTHVDSRMKIRQLSWLARQNVSFVCLSAQTANLLKYSLKDRLGQSSSKISYIDFPPFHEGPSRKLHVGFFSNIYRDGRKREFLILDSFRELNPRDFEISLMGAGLETLFNELTSLGFRTILVDHFDFEFYSEQLSHLDLVLYSGLDEGAVSVLDAIKAGVPVLITPVGFHLDFINVDSVTFFSSQAELTDALKRHASIYAGLRSSVEFRDFQNYSNSLLSFFSEL